MDVHMGIRDMIGSTPILKLNNLGVKQGVGIYAKLELMNPAGSVKDRVGLYMIKDAEERGLLKPGSTIIEPTAGNTGIGIALAALNKGYRVIFTVPLKFSVEKQQIMKALGAEIIHTPRELGMKGAEDKARELAEQITNSVILGQFSNPANPLAHYETTGPEIYEQMDGRIDYFVAGAGSGGTYSGAVKYLKEKDPAIRGVLADPYGSIIGGGEHADYNIEGIGNDFIADSRDITLVDKGIKVSDDEGRNPRGIIIGSGFGGSTQARGRDRKRKHRGGLPGQRRQIPEQRTFR